MTPARTYQMLLARTYRQDDVPFSDSKFILICFNAYFNILIEIYVNFLVIEENAYYKGRIYELNRQLEDANNELCVLRNDACKLRMYMYNTIASQEIDELREEIKRLRSTQEDPGETADIESEGERESRPIRRKKARTSIRREGEEQESGPDDELARVRYILDIAKTLYLLTKFSNPLFNLVRNESHT